MAKNKDGKFRVTLTFKRGEKFKIACGMLTGGLLLSGVALGSLFGLTGCGNQTAEPASLDAYEAVAESITDAQKLHDGIVDMAEQYKGGTIATNSVEQNMVTLVLVRDAVDKGGVEALTPADIDFLTSSWDEINTIDKADVQFDENTGKQSYADLYDGLKELCKDVGIQVYDINLSCTASMMKVGGTKSVNATVKGSELGVKWTSENDKIATVDSQGNIKAIGVGKCTITCSLVEDSSVVAPIYIDVAAIPVSKIEVSDTFKIKEEEKKTLEVKTNEDATDKTLTFKSSDTAICTVNDKGEVKGIKEGSCTITVSSKDGSVEKTVKITVDDKWGVEECDSYTMYSIGGNLYSGPGTSYDKLGWQGENTEVTVLGKVADSNWYKCKVGDKTGFMGGSQLQDTKVVHQSNNSSGGGNYSYDDSYDYSYDDGGSDYSYSDSGSSSSGGSDYSYDDGGSSSSGSSSSGGSTSMEDLAESWGLEFDDGSNWGGGDGGLSFEEAMPGWEITG